MLGKCAEQGTPIITKNIILQSKDGREMKVKIIFCWEPYE